MRPSLPTSEQIENAAVGEQKSFLVLALVIMTQQIMGSLVYPIAKYGLTYIEPFTFAFYRYLLSAIVLLGIVRLMTHRLPIERKDYKKIFLLGILIIPLNQTLFLLGQSMTGAGHGAVIFSTTPIFVFLLAIIHLKEKLIWRRALGIVMAVGGVAVIMTGGAVKIGTDYLIGDAIIVVSVIAWAYYTIIGRDLVRKYGAIRVTAYALASGTVLYTPFGLIRALHFDYTGVPLGAWGSVLYMSLALSGVVYVLWYWLLKHMDASRVAVYHNVQPIIATVVAYLFLGEVITVTFIIGGGIVLAGVIISEIGAGRKARAAVP